MGSTDDRELEIDRLRHEAARLITSLKLHIQIDIVKYESIRRVPKLPGDTSRQVNALTRRVKA